MNDVDKSPAPAGTSDGMAMPQRYWVTLCVLAGVALSSLDSAIANIALPTISRELAVSDAATVWVVNSYQLASAICLLPAATVGEIIGHKRVYAFGMIVFGLASLCCAFSPTLVALAGARMAQGLGGGCMAALGPALIREIYPRRIIGQGFALIALTVAMSGALGPTVASLILSVATWPWLFLVNLPVCLVAIPVFIAITPRGMRNPRPFDISGALLSAVALGLVVVGIDTLGDGHAQIALGALAVGLASFGLLIWQQMGRSTPLLPLDLLRLPVFTLSIVTSVCSYGAQILAYVSLPFLFQTVMHRSQVATGLLVTPWPLLVAVAAPIAGRLTTRYSAALLGGIGLAMLALGLFLLVLLPAAPADWDIAWRMGLCGVGFGFFQTPNNTAVMTAGPLSRTGAASGMLAVARTTGWCLGSALVTLIFAIGQADATITCLKVAAGFAAVGAVVSLSRSVARR